MEKFYYTGAGSFTIHPAYRFILNDIVRTLNSRGYTLRSGHNPGVDQAMEVSSDSPNTEIYLPCANYEGSTSDRYRYSAAVQQFVRETFPGSLTSSHPIQSIWADVAKVLGPELNQPSGFVLMHSDAPGMAEPFLQVIFRVAQLHNIPIYNIYEAETRHRVLDAIGR